MQPSYDIQCYDPRSGEDFMFPCAEDSVFSSLEHSFFVIEVAPKTTARKSCPGLSSGAGRETYAQLLTAALKATSSTGFVSVSHVTKRMREQGVSEIETGQRLCDSGLGYFDALPEEATRLLAARQEIQTYEEWIFGGCKEPFDLPAMHPKWYRKALVFELEFFLQQAERIGCLFYTSGETREDIIMLRLWGGAEEMISAFVSSGA